MFGVRVFCLVLHEVSSAPSVEFEWGNCGLRLRVVGYYVFSGGFADQLGGPICLRKFHRA